MIILMGLSLAMTSEGRYETHLHPPRARLYWENEMKVLIACEFSGIVREAFARRGHDAWSCDLFPSEIPGNHYQGPVQDFFDGRHILPYDFDVMIAHPPCTYLSTVGNRHLGKPGRAEKTKAAAEFFLQLWNFPIKAVCIENPVGYMSTLFRKPDQIIQPYKFGHPVQKRTCFWLRNLPLLVPTNILDKPQPEYICQGPKSRGKKIYYVEAAPGDGVERMKYRSRTFLGVADAMADQWGKL